MKGTIKEIKEHYYLNKKYGFITGEDNKEYYFDERSLTRGISIDSLDANDQVEYDVFKQPDMSCDKAINVSFVEPIKFYKRGYYQGIKKDEIKTNHLKQNSGEYEVLEKISKVLYISHISHHDVGHGTLYPFCLIGATKMLKQYVRGQYEFLLVFSHFDSEEWQQSTLKAAYHIRHRKEIAERRPLVNFYILVSNAKTLKQEIDKMKGGTSAAIIPFSFQELLNCSNDDLPALILNRFKEYLFENNMLGEKEPIEEETLLFGDRGKIADSIVQRCLENKSSGIFGLRRSGKSSVLRAVERRLVQHDIKYIIVQARSELEHLGSWKDALYDIARKVRIATSGIEQSDGESRVQYNERLKLSSTEEDYQKRPTQCFVEDVKLYTKKEKGFVIAIDEIELITYNTATSLMWKNLDSFEGFWGALRDSELALVLCGVNSTINEKSIISFNGQSCDNPMYERIHNCADFSKTYLPAFTDEQTGYMINTLGGYSNIGFNYVFVDINRAFGGQPYAIRQFCAYVFDSIKSLRTVDQLYQVTKPTVDALLDRFNNSREGIELFETILQHIQIYTDEFEILKNLALDPKMNRVITLENMGAIDHLEKYGLIEYDRITGYVTFNIGSIQKYISKNAEKNPEQMSNDERIRFVHEKVKICEVKMKKYLLNIFKYNHSLNSRNSLRGYLNNGTLKINNKAVPAPNPATCPIEDFFNHKLFIMYFSTIKTMVENLWTTCKSDFDHCHISKANFISYMEDLNAGRTDADHYDPEDEDASSGDWQIGEQTLQSFISAFNRMKTFFDYLNL